MGDVRDLLKTVAVELEARANDDERNMPGDGDGPSTLRKWARQLRAISERAAVPAGFVLAPREMTSGMFFAWTSTKVLDDGMPHERYRACYRAMLAAAPQPAGEVVEMSPEFTDSARGAIAWVLWHHQGGHSPIGQPLRFALGMGAGESLPEHLIADAKRWAESVGATSDEFHRYRVPPEPAPSAPAATGKELLQVADAEALAKPMMLEVAFDFADNPRPYHSLACPADTNGELYRALKVLAAEARRLAALAAAKDCLTTADMEGLAKAIFEAHREQYVGTSLWPMRGWDDVEQSTRDHWTHIARRLSGAEQADTLEALNETEKDIAIAQAVEFAQYVVDHAKGRMVEAAERFLSLPYSQEIAQRLTAAQQAAKDGE